MIHLGLSAIISAVVSSVMTVLVMNFTAPLTAHADEAVLRALDYQLVGPDGSPRGRWFELPNGRVLFELRQPSAAVPAGAVTRVGMNYGQPAERASIFMRDVDNRLRFTITLAGGLQGGSAGDLTRIAVADRNEKVRLVMGVDFEGEPFIVMLDATGQPTWNVGARLENVLGRR